MSFIDPIEARTMISLYKTIRQTIPAGGITLDQLTLSETFIKQEVQDLLDQKDCKGLRIFLSMDTDQNIRLILVGTNEKGEDLLPQDALIIERGEKEPPIIVPPSTINQ